MSLSDEILSRYLRVTQHASRQFRFHFGRLNLTFPQALVLNTLLEEDGKIPISALAERTGSANSTVSGIVDRLEKLGLVQRERSEADRRVIYVALTSKCRTMREDARTNVRGYFSGLLDSLSEEDKKIVLEGLNRLDWALGAGKEEEHET